MTSFGNFIKKERELRDWTQTDFGAKIGVNSSAVSRIENGTQTFSKNKLELLAQLFQLEIQKVIDLYFADKFAREANKYKCSETIFTAAEKTSNYLKIKKSKQGEFKF
ncbi:helix-turn-helix transcriptional regulator [Marivirga salinae]|uniref:Helix-turn-helix transcriptional regulator n=1 Tax=Marivirga salinarum TaxID=3059078 RepID=A0AA51RA75_9BACT|nr:helix-turn-helix transcriptional regulator [Marivirga sp. BDSF4-3]WMN10846.1 helix-turn-helix transcriptional regulator [Marivirga sp. BDSF4-3]